MLARIRCLLLGRKGADVAARDGRLGDDVGLARGGDAEAVGVDLGRRAARHHADVVGEVGLGQLAPEAVEDPRQLVDRAIAEAVAEDAARMAGAAVRAQRPARRAAPRHRAEVAAVLAGEIFELERDVGARPASIRSRRATAIGARPSSSPVSTISISASRKVPAACIARSAATITTMPPLSSPTPGPRRGCRRG